MKLSKILVGVLAASLAACTTSIPAQVKHLPTIDTSSITRISVMPFGTSDRSREQRQLAADLTREVTSIIADTNNFEMIRFETIEPLYKSGDERLVINVDGIFTGDIVSLTSNDNRKIVKKPIYEKINGKLQKTGEEEVPQYEREVTLSFTYRLLSARDRNIIGGEQRRSGTQKESGKESPSELTATLELAGRIMRSQLSGLSHELAPWTSTVYLTLRKLEKDIAKDKVAKALFKDADSAVKQRSYGAAGALFKQLYENYGSRAAGYNAGLMMEAQGDLSGAIALMRSLGETAAVSRMQSSVAAEAAVEDYKANRDSAINKSIKEASSAVLAATSARFPDGLKAAILKSATGTQYGDLLEYVVTGFTEACLSSDITLVERGPNEDLLTAEQQYQLSGNVSDEDIVSIGHEYGAEVLILLSITGASNMRQLKVEALSVETKGKLYMQTFDI